MRPDRQRTLTSLGLVALVGAGCDRPTVEATAKAGPSPVARVSTVAPERMTGRRTTEEPGLLEVAETTPLYAKLAGYVETVAVDIGDRVKKGQVLAELRMPEVEADLSRKRAKVEQARSEVDQAGATVEVSRAGVASAEAKAAEVQAGIRRADADVARWRSEFARIEQLVRERAQTGSLLDETSYKLRSAEATQEEVRAQVKTAQAALAEARALLDKARSDVETANWRAEVSPLDDEYARAMAAYRQILAPFDGVVTRRGVDVGRLTTPGAGGELLFVGDRSDIVTIAVGVPEADAPSVNPGDPAKVRLQAFEGRTFEGKVARTSWALDPATRTLRAEVDVMNPDGLLRPGLYAYATIVAEEHPDALTVPTSAVFADGGKSYCVVIADGRARRREVKLGLVDGKRTEVVSGLDPSDRVGEANAASLAEGQPVEPVASQDAAAKPKS